MHSDHMSSTRCQWCMGASCCYVVGMKSCQAWHDVCSDLVQETGRAGRDNKMATCIMYYSYGDAQKMRHMLKQSAEENGTSKEQMQHNTDSLNSMFDCLTNLCNLPVAKQNLQCVAI